jgi:pyruvate formate lyase activating enzyme
VDPIEKKPLYHFLPATEILSFGSIGCHLACKFCQNWHLSAAGDDGQLATEASPEAIAEAALRYGCRSVAFTYNDPIPSLEFVVDVAHACRERGLRTVAVTNGYITEEACGEFFAAMDAANVDLKSFSDAFYRRNCAARLEPVLAALRHIAHAGRTWLELTTLLIPGENDTEDELDRLTRWAADELGTDVPMHFSAFRPAFRMTDRPPTPMRTLSAARSIALRNGMRFVYTGNVRDPEGGVTACPGCKRPLILREGFSSRVVGMDGSGCCGACGAEIAGVWR